MVLGYSYIVLLLFILVTFVNGHSHEGESEHHHHECGEIEGDPSTYNTNMHVSAAFIVFAASLVGSLLPIVSSRMACLQGDNKAMEVLCSFGFGVVISTAFVHMIPPAISKLNNECLGLEYSGLAMVIVLATIYLMQLLETELVIVLSKYSSTKQNQLEQGTLSTPARSPDVLNSQTHGVAMLQEDSDAALRQKISAMIFEGGVAMHSIIIGVELGVASGEDFTTTVIAICFHQFFEGVAVGSSAITAFSSIKSLAFTAIVYALTTPLGVVIGILISGTYSDTSTTALWVQGSFDAIAGGILVYTGIVELVTYQYTTNADFHRKTIFGRAVNYLSLYAGSAAMAVIGKWA